MKLKLNKDKLSLKSIGTEKLILIVICGIVLLVCSVGGTKEEEEDRTDTEISYEYSIDEYEKKMEKRLEELLESMEGVGDAEVMLTIRRTEEKVVLKEEEYSKSTLNESDSEGGVRNSDEEVVSENTVYVTDKNGDTVPYVINEVMPQVEGVAIIAKGGESSATKEKIITVVKSLFDIEANKISISKMK